MGPIYRRQTALYLVFKNPSILFFIASKIFVKTKSFHKKYPRSIFFGEDVWLVYLKIPPSPFSIKKLKSITKGRAWNFFLHSLFYIWRRLYKVSKPCPFQSAIVFVFEQSSDNLKGPFPLLITKISPPFNFPLLITKIEMK